MRKIKIFMATAIAAFCVFLPAPGHAQMAFNTIKIVDVNGALKDSEVNGLIQRLGATFAPQVVSTKTNVPLDAAYNTGRSQYDAKSLLGMEPLFSNQQGGEYVIAIVPGDLYSEGFNFLFASTDFQSMRTVLGLARLETDLNGNQSSDPNIAALVADRVRKIILRRMGTMAGLVFSKCGPMAFSNSLAELDAMPAMYCPDDADFLKRRGYIR